AGLHGILGDDRHQELGILDVGDVVDIVPTELGGLGPAAVEEIAMVGDVILNKDVVVPTVRAAGLGQRNAADQSLVGRTRNELLHVIDQGAVGVGLWRFNCVEEQDLAIRMTVGKQVMSTTGGLGDLDPSDFLDGAGIRQTGHVEDNRREIAIG